MDDLHAIGFYASAVLTVGAALATAFVPTRRARATSLAVLGLGLAVMYAALSAAFAGVVALACYVAIALLLARPDYRSVEVVVASWWRQAGGIGAAVLVAILAYSAYRGSFAIATYYGGAVNTVAMGRALFAHDAMATEAVAAIVLVALVGASIAWRRERRARDVEPRETGTKRR